MLRAVLIAALVFIIPAPAARQATGVLRITVVLVDAEQRRDTGAASCAAHQRQSPERGAPANPHGAGWHRRRHAAAGNYTVESDRPVAFHGKSTSGGRWWTSLPAATRLSN